LQMGNNLLGNESLRNINVLELHRPTPNSTMNFRLWQHQGVYSPLQHPVIQQGMASYGTNFAPYMAGEIRPLDDGGLRLGALQGASSSLSPVNRQTIRHNAHGGATVHTMDLSTNGDVTGHSNYGVAFRRIIRQGYRSGESSHTEQNPALAGMMAGNPRLFTDTVVPYLRQTEWAQIRPTTNGLDIYHTQRANARPSDDPFFNRTFQMGDQTLSLERGREVWARVTRSEDGRELRLGGIPGSDGNPQATGLRVGCSLLGDVRMDLQSASIGMDAQGRPRMSADLRNREVVRTNIDMGGGRQIPIELGQQVRFDVSQSADGQETRIAFPAQQDGRSGVRIQASLPIVGNVGMLDVRSATVRNTPEGQRLVVEVSVPESVRGMSRLIPATMQIPFNLDANRNSGR
jgi:hypothetical protein